MMEQLFNSSFMLTVLLVFIILGFIITICVVFYSDCRVFDIRGKYVGKSYYCFVLTIHNDFSICHRLSTMLSTAIVMLSIVANVHSHMPYDCNQLDRSPICGVRTSTVFYGEHLRRDKCLT